MENCQNNSLDNLECLPPAEHFAKHEVWGGRRAEIKPSSHVSARSPKHDIARRKASPNIARLACWLTAIFRASPSSACTAARHSTPAKPDTRTAIAQTPAHQPTAASPALTTRRGYAPAAGSLSPSTNTAKPAVAADIVLSVCAAGKRGRVYDLMADDAGEFLPPVYWCITAATPWPPSFADAAACPRPAARGAGSVIDSGKEVTYEKLEPYSCRHGHFGRSPRPATRIPRNALRFCQRPCRPARRYAAGRQDYEPADT